jgi:hypothetical protein
MLPHPSRDQARSGWGTRELVLEDFLEEEQV